MAEPVRSARGELDELVANLRILLVDTGRVWWRLLPQLLGLYLLGWLGGELALRVAVFAGDVSGWLALVAFSFHFVALLAASVLILRLAGRELGVRALIPTEETVVDGRDDSVTRLLAVTLLPFLGIYAAFGQATEAADRLAVEQLVRYSVLGSQQTVLGVLNDAALQHPWRLLALVVGVYVLRRVLDALHERTGRGALGFAVVLVESFFVLLVLLGGVRVFQLARLWITDRAFWGWLDQGVAAVAGFLARFRIDLPAVLDRAAAFWSERLWPVLWEVVTQPLVWLAVAALVYGSQALSVAELWRRGRAATDRVPAALLRSTGRERRRESRIGSPPQGFRLAATQAKEAFLGDVDDKYLPTVNSLRLVLRAGVVFLGSFVLAYAVVEALRMVTDTGLQSLLGGHTVEFWTVWNPWIGLALALPFETLRLCLLAVAFRRCLELFALRRAPVPLLVPSAAPAAPAVLAGPAQATPVGGSR